MKIEIVNKTALSLKTFSDPGEAHRYLQTVPPSDDVLIVINGRTVLHHPLDRAEMIERAASGVWRHIGNRLLKLLVGWFKRVFKT